MKIADLENVLNYIRVPYYGVLADDADHLAVAFINSRGRRDVDIMVFDNSRYGTSRTFSFSETLKELKNFQENA